MRAELIEFRNAITPLGAPVAVPTRFLIFRNPEGGVGLSSNEEERSSPQCACAGMRRVPITVFLFSCLYFCLWGGACGGEGEGKRLRFWWVGGESCAYRGC